MENDNKYAQDTLDAPGGGSKEPAAQAAVRVLARAGESFDAGLGGASLYEGGLKDPSKVEPTDQSFVFAVPGERSAVFAAGDQPHPAEEPGAAQPALDSIGAADPDIPWRNRVFSAGASPPPVGVLRDGGAQEVSRGVYDTDSGLFGPGDPWLASGGESAELVLGVKFREYGPVYFFRAGESGVKAGGRVLVETGQGLSMAEVVSALRMRLPLPKIHTAEGEDVEISPILGLPGPEDVAADAENRILTSGARLFCKECIRERGLEMKLVDVEVLHDRSKIIFYFTAPTRIDFRDLVKDLVRNYRIRIELRQIGVRHETQMLGALGNCGMTCCCRRYLRRFAPVTIKMAKEQNLFLNPAKLSGICGRLLCCLANEQENYEDFHKNCPKIGKKYQTTRGVMRVGRASLFRQSITAVGENGEEEEFQLDSWRSINPKRLDARDSRGPGPDARTLEQAEAEDTERPSPFGVLTGEAELAGLADLEDDAPDAGPKRVERPGRRASERARQGEPLRRERREGGQGGAERDKSIFGLPGSRYNGKAAGGK